MSTETTSTQSTVPSQTGTSRRAVMAVGVVIVVLGVLAILAPFVTGVALSILLGALLVVGALAHVAHAFHAGGWTGSLWQLALAILYAFAGISLLANPVLGLATLTLLVIIYLAVAGIVEIVGGVLVRPNPGWGWTILSGVISLLLAALLWGGFPSTAAWAIGLLVGIQLLATGLLLVAYGYLDRRTTTAGGSAGASTG